MVEEPHCKHFRRPASTPCVCDGTTTESSQRSQLQHEVGSFRICICVQSGMGVCEKGSQCSLGSYSQASTVNNSSIRELSCKIARPTDLTARDGQPSESTEHGAIYRPRGQIAWSCWELLAGSVMEPYCAYEVPSYPIQPWPKLLVIATHVGAAAHHDKQHPCGLL